MRQINEQPPSVHLDTVEKGCRLVSAQNKLAVLVGQVVACRAVSTIPSEVSEVAETELVGDPLTGRTGERTGL